MSKLDSFVRDIGRRARDADVAGSPRPRMRFRTVVNRCGWSRRSTARLGELAEALEFAGVYCSPPISGDLDLAAWVHFTTRPERNPSSAFTFRTEQDLERFVKGYYAHLFSGHTGLEGAKFETREYSVFEHGHRRRLDLLFKGRDGIPIVVELKRGTPGRGALGQLDDYVYAVAEAHDGKARGVLVSGVPNDRALEKALWRDLQERRASGRDLSWLVYTLDPKLAVPEH